MAGWEVPCRVLGQDGWLLYLVEFCELFVKCFMCFDQRSVRLLIPATREGRKQGREGTGREREGRRWKEMEGEGRGGKGRETEFGGEKLTPHIQTSLIAVLVPGSAHHPAFD